jgi:hypothetical protein
MSVITDTLNAIKARAEAATPGPWIAHHYDRGFSHSAYSAVEGEHNSICTDASAEDSDFIAHSREDIERLVAALEKAMHALYWYEGRWPDCSKSENTQREVTAILTAQPEGQEG